MEAVKKITAKDFSFAYPNTEKRRKGERKAKVRHAQQRLRQILDNSFDQETEGVNLSIEYQILRLYEFEENEIAKTSLITAHKQAFGLIAEDLLWTEFYNDRGSLSGFAEQNYETLNPDEFKVIPVDWHGAKKILETHLKEGGWKKDLGDVEVDVEENVDLVAEYARFFGKDKIIALPITITINKDGVSIDYQGEFAEPYGGVYTERLVYLKKDFNAGPRPTKALLPSFPR